MRNIRNIYPGGNVSNAAFVAVVWRRRIGCPIESDFQEQISAISEPG